MAQNIQEGIQGAAGIRVLGPYRMRILGLSVHVLGLGVDVEERTKCNRQRPTIYALLVGLMMDQT